MSLTTGCVSNAEQRWEVETAILEQGHYTCIPTRSRSEELVIERLEMQDDLKAWAHGKNTKSRHGRDMGGGHAGSHD